MLDCKPDKLSHNAPSQSKAQEARQAIPKVHISRQAIPGFNGENTLDKKESHRPQGVKSREAETEGNVMSRNNQDYRTTHAAGS